MDALKKQLGLTEVFSLAAGAMISSGLFILPAIAFSKAGPGVILAYLLASILIIPSVLSKAELSTAMPRAGGTYFFVERSLGSLTGLFTGFAGWFSLALKSAFAIVGMAILIEIVMQVLFSIPLSPWHLKVISVVCCLFFMGMNIVSVKHTNRFQVLLVMILLGILAGFVGFGAGSIEISRFEGFLDKGSMAIISTAGLVFISFGGLTKVASIAEEVKQPGRNLPLGMIMAWFVVSVFYLTVITVTVGVVDANELSNSFLPLSVAAEKIIGPAGFAILALAAIAAFVTTANGGILAASRAPMAMGRDNLLPKVLSTVSKRFHTPYVSIILTGGFMIAAIITLDIESLVKTASTLMILLFILVNASVIIMRESKIQSYRPKFKSPMYPYIHIFAILVYGFLIIDMGKIPLIITSCFIVVSLGWYFLYVTKRVHRASAVMHIVERITAKDLKTGSLENELRDILLERDEIIEDRFDKLIKDCEILDIKGRKRAEEVFRQIAKILEKRLEINEYVIFEEFLHREAESGTVIQPGLAIPHIIILGKNKFDIMLIRAVDGIDFPNSSEPVHTMFVLVGSKDQRNYHLRALMAIAQIAQEKQFKHRWLSATDTNALRNIILLSTRKRDAKI